MYWSPRWKPLSAAVCVSVCVCVCVQLALIQTATHLTGLARLPVATALQHGVHCTSRHGRPYCEVQLTAVRCALHQQARQAVLRSAVHCSTICTAPAATSGLTPQCSSLQCGVHCTSSNGRPYCAVQFSAVRCALHQQARQALPRSAVHCSAVSTAPAGTSGLNPHCSSLQCGMHRTNRHVRPYSPVQFTAVRCARRQDSEFLICKRN